MSHFANTTWMNRIGLLAGLAFVLVLCVFFAATALAQPTPTINYQGKLSDNTGAAVVDGDYNARFWLFQNTGQATSSAIWTEELTGANQVSVQNGLFSVMLGSTSPLTSVDFNQPLFLGVEIGGTGAAVWDGEMLPRKPLGTVPAAFQAFQLGGVASSSFLRSDQADSMDAFLTLTAGAQTNDLIVTGTATTTNLVVGSDFISSLTGAGLTITSNALSVSSSSLNLTLDGLGDTNLSGSADGDLFSYNGSEWVNVATSSLGFIDTGATDFLSLTDTPGSFTANRLLFQTGSAVTDSADLTFDGSLFKAPTFDAASSTLLSQNGTRMFWSTTTSDSIAIGEGAGNAFNDTGLYNIALGYQAGFDSGSTTASDRLTAFGYQSAYQNTGANVTALGYLSAYENTGNNVTAQGGYSAYQNTGNYVTASGYYSARENTGTSVTAVGYRSAYLNTGANVTALGYLSAYLNTGANLTAVGRSSAHQNSGNNVTAVGYRSAFFNTGANVTALGDTSAYQNTGNNVTAQGYYSAYQNTGNNVTALGYDTANQNSGSNLTVIGYQASRYRNAPNSTIMGYQAGYGQPSTRATTSNNLILGYQSGFSIDTGADNNILLGYQAADSLTTGANNIVIGYDVEAPSNTADNQLNIGNLIFGTGIDGVGTTLSSGNVGIGTTSPSSKLDVWGDFRVGTSSDALAVFNTAANTIDIGTSASGTAARRTSVTMNNTTQEFIPSDPIIVGGVKDASLLNGPNSVTVVGRYAYVANNFDDSLRIIDVSDPTNPTIVGGVKDASLLNGASSVTVVGRYAYVANTSDDSLRIIDVSDPTNPTIVGGVKDASLLNAPQSVTVVGRYAYVASVFDSSLRIIDVSDPTNPTIIGGVKNASLLAGPRSVTVVGRYAYVANSSDDSLRIIDVSDPTSPTIVGGVKDASLLNGAHSVTVVGRYAYVANYDDDSLRIIDVSDPTNPTIVGGVKNASLLNGAISVTVVGRYAYVANQVDDSLRIIDVSDPTTPTIVGGVKDASLLNGASSVTVAGRYAYVANYGDASLRIIDLGGIDTPTGNIGSLLTTTIDTERANVNQLLTVGGGLNVGSDALFGGSLTITGTASSTLLAGNTNPGLIVQSGYVGIGTSSPYAKLSVDGDLALTGGIYDNSASLGTAGMVMQTTGTGVQWVATSSLGIGGGATDFLSLTDTPGSFTANQLLFTNSGGTALTNSTNLTFDGTTLTANTFNAASSTLLSQNGTRMFWSSTTSDSIAIGEGAGNAFNDTGLRNTALGYQAGFDSGSTTGSDYLTAVGYQSAYQNTGADVTAQGAFSAYLNTGSFVTAQGFYSALQNTGSFVTAQGYQSAYQNTGSYVTALGHQSAYANTGSFVTALGTYSAIQNTGANVTALGASSAIQNTGSNLTVIGADASRYRNAPNSTIIGYQAGYGQPSTRATTSNNLILGYQSGYSIDTGADNNILIGYQAANSLTTGANNIILGYDVEAPSNTADNQLNIGNLIFSEGIDGTGTTLSSGNIGIGTTSPSSKLHLYDLSNPTTLTVESGGGQATLSIHADSDDALIQFLAGGSDTWYMGKKDSNEKFYIGNTAIGGDAAIGDGDFLSIEETGEVGIGIDGARALLHVSGGDATINEDFGFYLDSSTGAQGDSYLGYTADRIRLVEDGSEVLSAAGGNIGIGTTTPNAKLTVAGNINIDSPSSGLSILGNRVFYASSTNFSTLGGESAGAALLSDGTSNTAFGYQALLTATSSDNNTAVGNLSLRINTTGEGNTAVGNEVLSNNTTGMSNTAIGNTAMLLNTSGIRNTAVGSTAMFNMSTGNYNVALGANSFVNNTAGWETVAIGYNALANSGTGSGNVAVGYESLLALSGSSGNNIAIGTNAGNELVSGSSNIIIGNDIDTASTSISNSLNIGNLIFGTGIDGIGTTLSSGNVGIGTSTPNAKLTVAGDINIDDLSSGLSFMGTRVFYASTTLNSVYIGQSAGNNISSTGGNNTAFGGRSMMVVTSANNNTAMGEDSLRNLTSGEGNTALGNNALYSNTTGAYNVGVGMNAGFDLNTAAINGVNTMIGYNTGRGVITGTANTILGANVTGLSSTLSNNIILADGDGNQRLNIDSDGNVGIGDSSPDSELDVTSIAPIIYLTDSDNAGVSDVHGAGLSWRTAANGVYATIGFSSDRRMRFYNEASGSNTNIQLSTEDDITFDVAGSELMRLDGGLGNVGIGTTTPTQKLTVAGNLRLTGALFDSTNASGTTGMVLQTTGTGTQWVATSTLGLGGGGASDFLSLTDTPSSFTTDRLLFQSGSAVTDSANLTYDGSNLGVGAGQGFSIGGSRVLYASTTNRTIVLGAGAGTNFTSDILENVAIGDSAMGMATSSARFNVAIGRSALFALTTGDNNVGIGRLAGSGLTTGQSNVYIGLQTGQYSTEASTNVGIGQQTLSNNISGDSNVALGHIAMQYSTTGGNNVAIGREALRNSNATNSVAIGFRSGAGVSGQSSQNNVFLGYASGLVAGTGADNNILIGYQAANSLTTGANNIIIGYDVEAPSNTADNQLNIGNLIFGTGIDGTGTTLSSGNIGIGTTTPQSKLSLQNDTLSGAGISGLSQYLTTTNSVDAAVQFGNYFDLNASNIATTTVVGSLVRVADDTIFGNTVRGLEVQANRGANTQGENTALSGFARTFGVRGFTSADAGGTFEPAAGFFETGGTDQGNAIRGYSSSITTTSLLSLFQDTSDFTGTGLQMNFGNTTGDFASSSSKYLDFQNGGSSVFTVSAFGTTTIGDGTTNNMAGLQIGYGGICVDNDGTCVASTTGQISSVSSYTGNSDLAEMYFSSEDLEPGQVVSLKGELSVERAEANNNLPILGVVSTKPGLTLGFDDVSTRAGESGFPIALSGRVPVQLSTENGAINAGDSLMLSSLPGIAMKADGTGVTVGIALEDFNESRLYSDTFINQFGDDVAEPVFTPITTNTDPRINDGCYFGGGGAADAEPCVPLTTDTQFEQLQEANELAEAESLIEAIEDLKYEDSKSRSLADGTRVNIGQIVMFVDRVQPALNDDQRDLLATLMGTSSLSIQVDGDAPETLLDRLVALADRFVGGVLQAVGIEVEFVKTDEVQSETLCLGSTCIDETELRALLEQRATTTNIAPEESEDQPEDDSEPTEGTDDSDDTTQPPVTTTGTTTSTTTDQTTDPVVDETTATSSPDSVTEPVVDPETEVATETNPEPPAVEEEVVDVDLPEEEISPEPEIIADPEPTPEPVEEEDTPITPEV